MTATWLILPPFAIASITRSIAEDVMVWLVALTVAMVAYFPASHFRAADEKYAFVGALVLMAIAASRQYWRRGTPLSRALIAGAVLLQALPLPESTALAIEGSRAPEMSNITITPQAPQIRTLVWNSRRGRCTAVPLSMGRARSNWRLEVRSQNSTFESADGKTWNTGWLPPDQGPLRYSWTDAVIYSCISPDGLSVLGAEKPLTLHVAVAFEVFAENPPVSVKAGLAPFDVPGVGNCQFATDSPGWAYTLACKAPVWFPPQGTIEISTARLAYPPISPLRNAWTPMNLLPGLSPVYKWTAIPIGLAASVREAIEQGGELKFRTETPIGLIRREVVVK